jgi:hypothetical protein
MNTNHAMEINPRVRMCNQQLIVWMKYRKMLEIFFSGTAAQRGLWPPHHKSFLDHTKRRAAVGRTPLDS